jgi:2',5'-phosphodiesterase
MDSACGTPEFTTYTIGFKDCLDYIFIDIDDFEVTSVIPFPLKETLVEQLGIPNVTFPSDHIACVADLKWKN